MCCCYQSMVLTEAGAEFSFSCQDGDNEVVNVHAFQNSFMGQGMFVSDQTTTRNSASRRQKIHMEGLNNVNRILIPHCDHTESQRVTDS